MSDGASAGATPAAGGATPPQNAQATGATQSSPTQGQSATDDVPESVGEAGRRAIQAERERARASEERAKTAERERDELRQRTMTDQEKAVSAARKEGADEAAGRMVPIVRGHAVRAALAAAGIQPAMLDLATKADEFTRLAVAESGDVAGLDAAVESFRKKMPDLFRPAQKPPSPQFDGGARGAPATGFNTNEGMNTAIRRAAGRI